MPIPTTRLGATMFRAPVLYSDRMSVEDANEKRPLHRKISVDEEKEISELTGVPGSLVGMCVWVGNGNGKGNVNVNGNEGVDENGNENENENGRTMHD
jgi:hypothetical protein